MKTLRIALMLAAASSLGAAPAKPPVHLEMDMTSEEYQRLTAGMEETEANDPLTAILGFGKRNLQWLDFINAARDAGQKLELSSAATQVGYPIDQPTYSNREIVARDWDAFVLTLPQVVKDVVIDGKDFTTDLGGMSDEQFITIIRALDKLYQRASRWLLQEPYLEYYAQAAAEDVRGYYFLAREPKLDAKLAGWAKLDDQTKARFAAWLISQCRNTGKEEAACKTEFDGKVAESKVADFFAAYKDGARDHYDGYFKLQGERHDIVWTSDTPDVAMVPFKNPQRDDVLNWLKANIEDEWKWNGWQLKLDFQDEGDDNMTHVVFQAGATPHVNDIAGSEITMDGNRNIGEYSSRWTIRHEYGHVLGFPDCYLEFYDTTLNQMVQYQLDITNLMCSRRGHLQQSHYDEMKRVYFRQ